MYFVTTMRCCFLDNKQQMKFLLVLSHFDKWTCKKYFATKFHCKVFLRIGKRTFREDVLKYSNHDRIIEVGQLDATILMLSMSWHGGHLDAKMSY